MAGSFDKLRVTVAQSTEEIAAEGWDELVLSNGGPLPIHDLHVSTLWLRRYEVFGDFDPHYAVAGAGEQLVGGVSTHRVDVNTDDMRIRIDGALANGRPTEELTKSILPCRIVGGLTDGRTGASFLKGLSLRERAAVVDRLFDEAEQLASRKDEKSLACRCVDSGDLLLRSVLRGRGYIEVPGPPHFILRTPPEGLDGYVGSFRKHRRTMIRSEIRKLHEADVTIGVEPLTKELADSVLPLIRNLNDRYGVASDRDVSRAELGMLRKLFKSDVRAVVARHDGQPVGYMDFIVYRDNAWTGQAGFDYQFQDALPLYFGTLFYGVMDFAASARLSSIDYAFASEEAKASRGCVARPTVRLVRALDPVDHRRLVTWAEVRKRV